MLLSIDTKDALIKLGNRLRNERLRRNESQRIFAARIGVSIPTLHKMESGDSRVQFGYWVATLDILGRIDEMEHLLSAPENMFDKYQQSQRAVRQRASRRKTG